MVCIIVEQSIMLPSRFKQPQAWAVEIKYLGYALIEWGVLDFGLSYAGANVWMDWLGMELPEAIWRFSGKTAVAVGYGILKLAGGDKTAAEPVEGAEESGARQRNAAIITLAGSGLSRRATFATYSEDYTFATCCQLAAPGAGIG